MMDNHENFQLIDVREPHEFDIANINGELIPMGDIPDNIDKISKDKPVIIHCLLTVRGSQLKFAITSNKISATLIYTT